jgi:hypothetical protein
MSEVGLVAGAGAPLPSELPGLDASRPLVAWCQFPRHADGDVIVVATCLEPMLWAPRL